MKVKETTGYRVYERNRVTGKYRSYYASRDITKIGEKVEANADQFHAWERLKDVKLWLKQHPEKDIKLKVYKVTLGGNLMRGVWEDDKNIQTVTGDYLILLEDISEQLLKEGKYA